MRDAAVDPMPKDYRAPVNAGRADPHGPQVVSVQPTVGAVPPVPAELPEVPEVPEVPDVRVAGAWRIVSPQPVTGESRFGPLTLSFRRGVAYSEAMTEGLRDYLLGAGYSVEDPTDDAGPDR
jgi:hypothetical protein